MTLAENTDVNEAIMVASLVKRAEELTHELQDRFARKIRNEIVEALDGKKSKITG